jgi:uncharacterized protein YndB with AHSA1/START domain
MPVTSVNKDAEHLTMTVVAEFPHPVDRVWAAYADPRQIEKFWGPPTYPAVFTRHDMFAGGRSEYVMIGPDGDESRGYWEFIDVRPTTSFEVRDGFANPDGTDNADMPSMRMVFDFAPTDSGTRVTTTTYFNSADELAQLLAMGMEEGMSLAMAQIDAVLDDLTSFAAGVATTYQILSDTQVRVSRIIAGPAETVWEAHHRADLVQRWLLGPEGWSMPVCEIAEKVGDTYRYEWEQRDGDGRFGFTGVLLASEPPRRAVTTERMIGVDGPELVNEMTLTPIDGETLLSIVITYPDAATRDAVLATGMTDGMEASYRRLEGEILAPA